MKHMIGLFTVVLGFSLSLTLAAQQPAPAPAVQPAPAPTPAVQPAPAPAPAVQPAPAPATASLPAPAPAASLPPQAPGPVVVLPPAPPAPPVVAPGTQPNIYDPNVARYAPKKLRPVPGMSPPVGYVEAAKPRKGLVISGSIIFGVSYGFALIGAGVDDHSLVLAIPLVGPMIWGFQYDDLYEDYYDDDEAEAYYGVMWSLAQIGGLTMLIVGLAAKKKTWLRWDIAGADVHVMPVMTADGSGALTMHGTF